ncbi:MAG: thiamine ABC transporter substrate-binding protein [Spirochaetaceae bacterium]|nr:thiamine ABC transporter substrate-binding protein [Spirochaetaceae bacterium]
MKKNYFLILITLLLCVVVLIHVTSNSPKKNADELVILTYSSFASEWGPAPLLQKSFYEKTGIKLVFVDCGDGVQVLNKAIAHKNKPYGDIILGIDNILKDEAYKADILLEYKPSNATTIPQELFVALDNKNLLIPYDFSHFALIYDTKSSLPEPKSLQDLANPLYKKKIILMDPRTSTPGLGFLSWTCSVFQEDYLAYWKTLKENILSFAPSWSLGWGMFLKGEAPLVISYTTSPAYTLEIEKNSQYKALIFDEGHIMQVEGCGILKNSKNIPQAKEFIDFLISEEAQEALLFTQWMYPANKNVAIPESYMQVSPLPKKTLAIDIEKTENSIEKVISILQ